MPRLTQYCTDYKNIENYEKAKADNFKGWCIHHRRQTHNSDGERLLVDITAEELNALDMYYDRPPEELIFMTASEHSRLHTEGKKLSEETKKKIGEASRGRHHSEETKKRLSESLKGEKNPNYGKHLSEETKRKLSESCKNVSDETRKKLSEANKGENNSFYGKHHSDETKKKIGEKNKVIMKGMRYFNNGTINKRAKECPEGFVPGRLKRNK